MQFPLDLISSENHIGASDLEGPGIVPLTHQRLFHHKKLTYNWIEKLSDFHRNTQKKKYTKNRNKLVIESD